MSQHEDDGIEIEEGIFVLPKGRWRARQVALFRVRIIDGLPHLCFRDSYNSRRGETVEVTVPFHQLIEMIHRFILKKTR